MQRVHEFPQAVRVLRHVWIPMRDGVPAVGAHLAPRGRRGDPVPAILEYIPYRKDDATALATTRAPPVFRRPRLRRASASTCAAAATPRASCATSTCRRSRTTPSRCCAWLAPQPWCTGSVGMIGISWGGFNGLQVAARRPPAAEGDHHALLDRRPLRRRRPLHRRLRPGRRHALVGVDDARLQRAPARPGGRRRRLARRCGSSA